MRMSSPSVGICLAVVAANIALWAWLGTSSPSLPDWKGPLRGLSYSPYEYGQDPRDGDRPSLERIARDVEMLSDRTSRLRVYSTRDGLEAVVRHASLMGLTVTAGAWITGDYAVDEAEIRQVAELANRFPYTVERVIVGNESMLRNDVDAQRMVLYLNLARALVNQPVSTAEPWHVWLANPVLGDSVDYVAAHVLPYWEGVPVTAAVDHILERHSELRQAFPKLPILLAEVGWPSEGRTRKLAEATVEAQATFVRSFLPVARARGLDYFMIEAFDQPWKITEEGAVGAYWGLFDAERRAKFAFSGPVAPMPGWSVPAMASGLLALFLSVWFVRLNRDLGNRGAVLAAVAIQLVATAIAWTVYVGASQYLRPVDLTLWTVVLAAQLLLYTRFFAEAYELTELLCRREWRRSFTGFTPAETAARPQPKVSIHLPICREPPDMVIETLRSLARLDYPDFEVLVVDNNTSDPALWRPVEEACRDLGGRFRFFHLETWPGYKAGALNFALSQTAADAAVIGVLDADYIVEPHWLSTMMPHFGHAEVGFVQAPQDHRDWHGNAFKTMCNWEFAGFFHTGMVHRNERDAIIQHGTMTLIRREALEQVGGWAEWCICEDAELGLRLMEAGHQAVYVNETLGRGVTPDGFAAYRSQRFRWAFGAMQILRGHGRRLLGLEPSGLTGAQRFHFVAGWLPWFTDAIGLVFTVAALAWSLALTVVPKHVDFPLALFVVPTVGMFAFRALATIVLYRRLVPCSFAQTLGAVVGGLSLTYVIARAVLIGLFTARRPFLRTPKMANRSAVIRSLAQVWEETAFLLALMLAAGAFVATHGLEQADARIWLAVLAVQAVPFAAAVSASLVAVTPAMRQPRRQRDAGATAVAAPQQAN